MAVELKPEYHELSLSDIEAIVAIARQRAGLKHELKAALEAGDELKALQVAYQLTGVRKKGQ
jgi:hypothetical protein